jgi:hypothetical protein
LAGLEKTESTLVEQTKINSDNYEKYEERMSQLEQQNIAYQMQLTGLQHEIQRLIDNHR